MKIGGTHRWAKRAKERAWRVWPMTWRTWASKSRTPSDTNLMGLDSSNVDPAAAQHSNNRIDDTKFTRPIFYFFFWFIALSKNRGFGWARVLCGIVFCVMVGRERICIWTQIWGKLPNIVLRRVVTCTLCVLVQMFLDIYLLYIMWR